MKEKIANRKIKILYYVLSSLILITACNKTNNNSGNSLELKENVQTVLNILEENKHNDLNFDYYTYLVIDGQINDWMGFEYDVSDYGINDGVIVEDSNHNLYISLTIDDYCAVKKFNESTATIYSQSNTSNCHIPITYFNEEPSVLVSAKMQSDDSIYKVGSIADGSVYLEANTNILDPQSYTYKWYRNDEEIANSNVKSYIVAAGYENAKYYVEIIMNNGKILKSVPMIIKINKRES